eukprot:g13063.t1
MALSKHGGRAPADLLTVREKNYSLLIWAVHIQAKGYEKLTDPKHLYARCLHCRAKPNKTKVSETSNAPSPDESASSDTYAKYAYWSTAHARGNKCKVRQYIDCTEDWKGKHDVDAGLGYALELLQLRSEVLAECLPASGARRHELDGRSFHPFFEGLKDCSERQAVFKEIQGDLAQLSSRSFKKLQSVDWKDSDRFDLFREGEAGEEVDDEEREKLQHLQEEEEWRYVRILTKLRPFDTERDFSGFYTKSHGC